MIFPELDDLKDEEAINDGVLSKNIEIPIKFMPYARIIMQFLR